MFVSDVALIFFISAYGSALGVTDSEINSEDFVFPLQKSEYFSQCSFKNGTNGQCVKASQCPKAHDEYKFGVNPTLCQFEKNELVVCCMITDQSIQDLKPMKMNNTITENNVERSTLRPLFEYSDAFVVIGPPSANVSKIPQPLADQSTQFFPSVQLIERRKSVAKCEDVYSLPVPFKSSPGLFHITIVGGQVTSTGEFPHMVRCCPTL